MSEPVLLIDKSIKTIKYVFTLTGINIKYDKTKWDKYRSWFIYSFNFLWLNTDIAGSFLWFLDGVAKNKKITELTYVTPCTIFSCLSVMKTFCIVMNENTFDLLIASIRKLENQQKEREQDAETERIITSAHTYVNKVMKILRIFYIALVFSFALCPTLVMYAKYRRTNELELHLPFLIVYPFDPFEMRYYPWVYLHQVWSEIVVLHGLLAADFMFYIFCTYLSAQFHLLGHYIENLFPEDEELKQRQSEEEMNVKLVLLVKWHQEIVSAVQQLDSLYTKSTLFNFISSSMLICFTGFNLMVMDDLAFIPTFFSFLLINLLQIFFQCYFGDMLMRASMEVGDSIYNSRWYYADLRLRKTMFVVQMRAQVPCKLTAYKFAEVNMNAFMKIGSTAWSYFALLRTMYS